MNILTISLRNLGRHRRRTLFTAGSVAVGLLMHIFLDSLLLGSVLQTERNLKWYETAMLRIMHTEYWDLVDERPLHYLVENPEKIIETLPPDWDIAPRLVFSADAVVYEDPYSSDGTLRVTAYAIDPSSDTSVFRTFTENPFTKPNGVILGTWVAEDLGAEIGYPLTLITKTREGFYQTIDLQIEQIIYAPNPVINRSLYVPLSTADEVLGMNGAVTELNISLPEVQLETAQATLRQELPTEEFSIMNWRELAADFYLISETEKIGSGFMILLILIIAAVGITNTMLMAVQERRKEMGMLQALGMSRGELLRMFIFEACGIAVIGSLAAMVASIPLIAWLVNSGIDYSFFFRDFEFGYRISDVIYGAWNPLIFVQTIAMAIVIAVLTAILPVKQALKQTIVSSLKA